MKPTAVILIAALLFQILMPSLSIAAQEIQGNRTWHVDWPKVASGTRKRQPSEEHRAAENAARLIRLLYEMDVWVMSKRHLDLSKITKGFYAHVIHRKEGPAGTATGVILDNCPDGLGIKSTSQGSEKDNVLYADIDTLVVAKDRRAFERWQRRMRGRFHVMTQRNLDLSKLNKGWHAFVVYRFEERTRAELTEITDLDDTTVVVRSNYAGGDQFWADGEIANDDIIIIVSAEDRGDILEWKNARQVIRHLPLNPRIRFNAAQQANPGRYRSSGVGRLLEVRQDTIVIGAGLSEHEVFRVPISSIDNFEINIGRYRNTNKGMGIGLVLGLGLLVTAAVLDATGSGTGDYKWFVTRYTGFIISLPVFVCSTLIGYSIKTDRWVDVPLKGIELSVSPTRNRGLGAAVSFDF